MYDFERLLLRPASMKPALTRSVLWGLASAAFVSGAPAFAGFFSAGDVIVVRMGDGSAALSGAATAVFLDEYTANGRYGARAMELGHLFSFADDPTFQAQFLNH